MALSNHFQPLVLITKSSNLDVVGFLFFPLARYNSSGFKGYLTHFLFSCLIKSFIINDVSKDLKENVNVKVKSKDKVVFCTLYLKNWKID